MRQVKKWYGWNKTMWTPEATALADKMRAAGVHFALIGEAIGRTERAVWMHYAKVDKAARLAVEAERLASEGGPPPPSPEELEEAEENAARAKAEETIRACSREFVMDGTRWLAMKQARQENRMAKASRATAPAEADAFREFVQHQGQEAPASRAVPP